MPTGRRSWQNPGRACARGDVRRGRLLGRRRAAGRGRPRRRRGDPQAVGRPVGLGLLLGGRRRRRPPGGPAARHRPPRLQHDRRVRGGGGRAVRRRPRRRPDAQPVHRVQPAHQVRPPARPGRSGSASTSWPPATTPRSTGPSRRNGDVLELRRGADPKKDQSYVLSMLGQDQLARVVLPVGHLTKAAVRDHAARLGLRTADKPDSQDVCFIHGAEGRPGFLGRRLPLHPADVVDERVRRGRSGAVDAVELVTVGQRRGMGHGTDGQRRYVVAVDVPGRAGGRRRGRRRGGRRCPARPRQPDLGGRPAGRRHPGVAQTSAHGRPAGAPSSWPTTGRSSGSTSGSARWRRARRSPSTTPATPTRSSGPASPPDDGRRVGGGRPGGGRRAAPGPGPSSCGS